MSCPPRESCGQRIQDSTNASAERLASVSAARRKFDRVADSSASPHAVGSRAVAHDSSPAELSERIAAERAGAAFFVLRDAAGQQQIVALDPGSSPLSIGRSSAARIRVAWDRRVSRLHAELRYVGGHWTVSDSGLSRNGTFVEGERLNGSRRLHDGDQVLVGATKLTFRNPLADGATSLPTATSDERERPHVSPAQRQVAVALCRPFKDEDTFVRPASNEEIAAELNLSVATVKTHLRGLYRAFGLDSLPQGDKRLRLVERLLSTNTVSEQEL
jgi:pSer/pThr/pTyr-binding forkhead associated (FHA) protein